MSLVHHYAQLAPTMVRNLRTLYAQATATERTAGRAWYPVATEALQAMATEHSLPLETVASACAAMSPQVSWGDNLEATRVLLYGHFPTRPLRANVAKAAAILADGAVTPGSYFKDAPKVLNFAANLCGDTYAVTVDTHMGQAMLGDVCAEVRLRGPLYAVFVGALRQAASDVHESPAVFQAICWVTWRRLHPAEAKRKARARW